MKRKSNEPRHGDWGTPLYIRYIAMKGRCFNPNRADYKHYGGRGIGIDSVWDTYLPFKEWALENGFNPALSLDRIRGNENYGPNNCRWVSQKIQVINRRQLKANTTGYPGVYFKKSENRYEAYIGINKKRIYLGTRETAKEASILYLQAKKERDKDYEADLKIKK